MKWSWKIGEFRGIGLFVHATFFILIGWVALEHWARSQSVPQTLEAVSFILALFACVVLHEFGHALTAARYGIKTQDITLLPIGGLARLEKMPDEPMQEFWVALAGPAVNVVIAALLYVWLMISGQFVPFEQLDVAKGPFVERLLIVNIVLVIFNMLPAFPMDGGRVLRALLATRMDYTHATQFAANVGQGMALMFGLLGFLAPNVILMFIALFVWIGAGQEAAMTMMKAALGGIPVRKAMVTRFRTLEAHDTLATAIEEILKGSQPDFPVVDGNRVVGILTRSGLIRALSTHAPEALVVDHMDRKFETVDPGEMLELAFRRLQNCECRTIPVLHRGLLVGLLTMDNVGEFLAIQSALHHPQGSHA